MNDMEEVTNINKLSRMLEKGAWPWYQSADFPDLYYWNTTGKEHALAFPTYYATRENLEKANHYV